MSQVQVDGGFVRRVLEDLVRINSVNPRLEKSPGEAEISDYIASQLRQLGLQVRLQEVERGRANVIGILRGRGGGRSLMLNGHCDTVGVQGMAAAPFTPAVENGRLHGRGSADMKGGLAAMLAAVKAVMDGGLVLAGDVVYTSVVDEEYESVGIRRLCSEVRCDAGIVGEPTGLAVATAHKGFMWIQLDVQGKAAHGSVPERGIDAIVQAARLVTALEEWKKVYAARRHPLLGPPVLHTSMIEGGREWATVPDMCRLRLERRTLPAEDPDQVLSEIKQVVERVIHDQSPATINVTKFYEAPALETSQDEAVVQFLGQAILSATRSRPKMIGVPYWSDASILWRVSRTPVCLYGPGEIAVAHSADEFVLLKDVEQAAQVLAAAIQLFCGPAT